MYYIFQVAKNNSNILSLAAWMKEAFHPVLISTARECLPGTVIFSGLTVTPNDAVNVVDLLQGLDCNVTNSACIIPLDSRMILRRLSQFREVIKIPIFIVGITVLFHN